MNHPEGWGIPPKDTYDHWAVKFEKEGAGEEGIKFARETETPVLRWLRRLRECMQEEGKFYMCYKDPFRAIFVVHVDFREFKFPGKKQCKNPTCRCNPNGQFKLFHNEHYDSGEEPTSNRELLDVTRRFLGPNWPPLEHIIVKWTQERVVTYLEFDLI